MTQASVNWRISKKSLPTTKSEKKYFYLTNSNYDKYPCNIYICLEDNGFGLNYYNVRYCGTNTNPNSSPDSAITSCSFTTIYYYSTQSSSGSTKYYYSISTSSSYDYTIVYYQGSNSNGNIYVISDYIELAKTIKMTQVSINSRISLETSSSFNKYFYLTNSNYLYSSYIYICLEDNNFGLSYNNIKYCCTNTDVYSPIDIAVLSCSFINSNYYGKERLLVQINIIIKLKLLI